LTAVGYYFGVGTIDFLDFKTEWNYWNKMKALILAGGLGKRLKPITDYVPKPLIPINNIPIIEWQIRYLKKFGIKDFVFCTGYKTEQIENYLEFLISPSESRLFPFAVDLLTS